MIRLYATRRGDKVTIWDMRPEFVDGGWEGFKSILATEDMKKKVSRYMDEHPLLQQPIEFGYGNI